MAVTLPFVLLLLDYWPLRRLQPDPTRAWPDVRILAGAVIEKLPLFVLVGAAAVVTFTVQGEGGNFSYTSDLPPGVRLATVSHAYVAYLADSVWPSSLAAIYPIPIEAPPLWRTIAEMASLLALTVLTLFAAPRRPYLVVGWLWFIGMLVPVVGWVHVGMQARADRYMYLPQVGLAIALTWGVAEILASHRSGERLAAEDGGDTLESSRARTSSWAAALVAAAATIVLTALALCSWRQVGYWRDSITLFRRAVDTTQDNALARYNLGTALGQAGRIEEAVAQQEEAHRIMLRAEAARMRRAGED
jgi:hypothetical protein